MFLNFKNNPTILFRRISMKIFKRTLAAALALIMLFGASSCVQKNDTNSGNLDSDSGSSAQSEESSELESNSDSESNGESESESESDTTLDDLIENGDVDADIQIDESNKKDLARYSIIANKDNALALNAATALSAKLAEKGITLPVNTSGVYEILIGNNDTPETKSASVQLSKLTRDYLIQFNDTKIVIVAKTDLALSEACNTFFEAYVSKLTGTVMTYKDGSTTSGTAKSLVNLAYSKKPQYSILTRGASTAVQNKVTVLVDAIKAATGLALYITTDKYSSTENQIIIGDLGVRETMKALTNVGENEYVISKVDNKVVIAGRNDNTTTRAIDAFIKLINDSKAANPDKSTFTISITEAIKGSYSASLSEIPRYPNATFSTTYPSGTGITQQYYTSANPNGITDYLTTLATLGYKRTEDNSINGNRFVTCHGAGGLVHISYLNYNKTLTVILDSLNGSVYKTSEPAYTKVTETALTVMAIDYDTTQTYNSSKGTHDASGMSYVITLEDGRYIIIDGGYWYKSSSGASRDANNLYNFLKSNNKRKDGKIVIAAWIFTHDHSDHHGAFSTFADYGYGSKVELQYYISNFGDKSRYTQQPSGHLDTGIPGIISSKFNGSKKKIVPHTGQKITFCNTTFEFMSTQESHAPNKMELVNDASLIIRMTANGVKTLFLADTEAQTTSLLLNMYGSTLKSDIMQLAHHGFSGGSTTLYSKIAPKYTLWPTSQECFNERSAGGGNGNAQAQNKWVKANTTSFVGDNKNITLNFIGGTDKIKIAASSAPNWAKS